MANKKPLSSLNAGKMMPLPIVKGKIELSGTRIDLRGEFDSNPSDPGTSPMGFVVAFPQVPSWLSANCPDATGSDCPKINKYMVEWFEKLVYLDFDEAKAIVKDKDLAAQAAVTALAESDLILQDAFALGCARTAPLLDVIQWQPSGKCTAKGKYHLLVDVMEGTKVLALRIVKPKDPMGKSLKAFVNSERHKKLKKEQDSYRRPPDPLPVALQKRMLRLAKKLKQVPYSG